MTDKENALHAFKHDGKAKWIANAKDAFIFFAPPASKDKVKEGKDWFGVSWRDYAPLNQPLFKISEWKENLVFPDLEAIDWEKDAAESLRTMDRENKLLWLGFSQGLFDRLQGFLGVEGGLTSFYEDPEATHELLDALTDFRIRLMEKLIDAYDPDIVDYRDDYGTMLNLFFSPEIFDEFFKERIRRIGEYIHSRGKVFVLHSCGKVEKIVDRFVEIGVDTWDSVMPCNDLPSIYEKFGDKIGFSSNMDLQKFGYCSEEEAREIVRYYIDTLGGRRNLILFDTYPIDLPLNPDVLTDEIKSYGRRNEC